MLAMVTKVWLAAVLVMACATDETDDAINAINPSAEFGFSCRQQENIDHLVTYCHSRGGDVGICTHMGVCLPKCETEDSGCPAGHLPIPTIGTDENGVGNCTCYPKHCAEPLLAHSLGVQDPLPVNCGPVDLDP